MSLPLPCVGVDWAHVERYCNFTEKLKAFSHGPAPPRALKRSLSGSSHPATWRERLAAWFATCCNCRSHSSPGSPTGHDLDHLGKGGKAEGPGRGPSVFGIRVSALLQRVGLLRGDSELQAEGSGAAVDGGVSGTERKGSGVMARNGSGHGRTWAPGVLLQQLSNPTIEEHHEEGIVPPTLNPNLVDGMERHFGGAYDDEQSSVTSREGLSRPSVPPGLLVEVLPMLAETRADQIDVLQHECALLGKSRLGERRVSGSSAPPAPKVEETAKRQEAASRQAGGTPAAAMAAATAGAYPSPFPGFTKPEVAALEEGMVGDAYSAAVQARSARSQSVQQQAQAKSPKRGPGVLRALATRSASPYLAYAMAAPASQPPPQPPGSDAGAESVGGSSQGAASRAGAASGKGLYGSTAGGASSSASLPLSRSTGTMAAVAGGGAAAQGGSGRPPTGHSAAGALAFDPMEKALGRPSRSLATRSVNVLSAYGGGGGGDSSGGNLPLPHALGGSPTAASGKLQRFGYSSQVGGHSDSDIFGTAEAAAHDPAGRRERPLATRSVGPGGGVFAFAAAAGEAASGPPARPLPSLAKLSTREAPHMAPIAPSLGKISTGLAAAYASGVGGSRGGNLHAQSVPLFELARSSRGTAQAPEPLVGPTSSVLGRTSWQDVKLGRLSAGGREGAEGAGAGDVNQEALADARMWLVSGGWGWGICHFGVQELGCVVWLALLLIGGQRSTE